MVKFCTNFHSYHLGSGISIPPPPHLVLSNILFLINLHHVGPMFTQKASNTFLLKIANGRFDSIQFDSNKSVVIFEFIVSNISFEPYVCSIQHIWFCPNPLPVFFSFSCLLLAHRRWLSTFYIQFSAICTNSFSVFVTKHITAWRWWITWPLFGVKVSLCCSNTHAHIIYEYAFKRKYRWLYHSSSKNEMFSLFPNWYLSPCDWTVQYCSLDLVGIGINGCFFSPLFRFLFFLFLVDMSWKLNEWNLYSFNNVGHIFSFFLFAIVGNGIHWNSTSMHPCSFCCHPFYFDRLFPCDI